MRYISIGMALILVLGVYGWGAGYSRDTPAVPDNGLTVSEEPMVPSDDVLPATSPEPESPFINAPTPHSAEFAWKSARATVFWVGEGADDDNGFIHNRSSAWDVDWETNYGGFDDPECRNGSHPCGFAPKENPFYVALPYNDIAEDGSHKHDPRIPAGNRTEWQSDLKDRWIAVRANGKICYAQWEDVGPFGEDDIEYVFGTAETPLNERGERAGIDLSPAVRDCLGVDGLSDVEWRHIEEEDVPSGPWSGTVTRPRYQQ